MKTKEQILEWLDKQPWKGEFYESYFLSQENTISYDWDFLFSAFNWSYAKPNETVWEKRNADFIKWYENSDKPMSWEEYCRQNPIKAGDSYIDEISGINYTAGPRNRDEDDDVNVMPEYLCEAFLAYMKLIQLRNAWVKDYDVSDCTVKIVAKDDAIFKDSSMQFLNGLSFPTHEMAEEFINTFKDLLELAKPLL